MTYQYGVVTLFEKLKDIFANYSYNSMGKADSEKGGDQRIVANIESISEFREMNDNETVLKEVFGESSDSDSESCEQVQHHHHHSQHTDCEETSRSNRSQNLRWERIDGIKGLCLCRDFLSPQEQSSLLRSIEDGTLSFNHNFEVWLALHEPIMSVGLAFVLLIFMFPIFQL